MSCRSPLTVPITTLPTGSMPEAERIGSMCAMPAFIARAQASTSGTKMKFSRNLMPTTPMPAIRPSSMISSAVRPSSSAPRVSSSTVSSSPSISAAAISLQVGRRARELRDQPLALVGPLDELLDLLRAGSRWRRR